MHPLENQDWYVNKLSLNNFRNYGTFEITFGRQITLLIGENGSGKSSILDALAIMLSTVVKQLGGEAKGFSPTDVRKTPQNLEAVDRAPTNESHFPVSAKAEGSIAGEHFKWERSLSSERGHTSWGDKSLRVFSSELIEQATSENATEGDSIVLPVLAYYGVERLVAERKDQGTISPSRRGAYYSALDTRSDLKRLFTVLKSLDEQVVRAHAFGDREPTSAKRQFEAIDLACTSILMPVGWGHVRWNSDVDGLTLHHPDHGRLPLTMLASGTKIAAGLAIDLASRMARANPSMGGKDLLSNTPGIVLIDEVDLHLHPTWQQKIVPSLQKTFPRLQFVLTTHSPQVISTVAAENVRVLHDSDVTTPKHSEGLQSGTVLSVLQGTNPAPSVPIRERLSIYLNLVDAGKGRSPDAVALREELDRVLGGPTLVPELLHADTAMAVAEWDI